MIKAAARFIERPMQTPNLVKTTGYLVSTISVILLGAVAWKGAKDNAVLLTCLIAGMAASIIGMLLRWISYQIDEE